MVAAADMPLRYQVRPRITHERVPVSVAALVQQRIDVVKQTALNPPQHVAITYNTPTNTGFFTDHDIIYTLSQ